METNDAHLMRIEEASLNAWPALYQVLHDGWLLRFSRGFTKRSNSIVPLYAANHTGDEATLEKIRFCENLYAREGLPTTFRLPSMVTQGTAIEARLIERGYLAIEETLVLSSPLTKLAQLATAHAFELAPLDDWLKHYAHLIDAPQPASDMHRLILRSIFGECGFGVVQDEDQARACGLGVVEDGLLGFFDIVTHPVHRQRGFATEMMAQLAVWGIGRGASTAYLQVVADNAPAIALYQKLGFSEAYRYRYLQAQ